MLNVAVIMGRLVADPELRHTPSDIAVCTFTIANDTGWGDNKKTNFFSVVAWRTQAEFVCKYLGKGDMCNITGKLQQRKYTDKEGNNRSVIEIVANEVDFCGGKSESKSKPNVDYDEPANEDFEEIQGDDDLPF